MPSPTFYCVPTDFSIAFGFPPFGFVNSTTFDVLLQCQARFIKLVDACVQLRLSGQCDASEGNPKPVYSGETEDREGGTKNGQSA